MLRKLVTVGMLSILSSLGFAQPPRGTLLLIPTQPGSPVQIVEATFGIADLIEGAKLVSRQQQRVTSYKLMWIEIESNGNKRIQKGTEKILMESAYAGQIINLPAQGISTANLRRSLKEIRFYIAELGFADGSRWQANPKKLEATKQK
ncbi:MAG TPA: hypothetical protein VMZ25_06700 [Terriglobales bacterium]|nr:hypothetical protein [Terriglobales bacterium]